MKSLLAQLGTVCEACSTWSEPGSHACRACGEALPATSWLHGGSAAVEEALPQHAETPALSLEAAMPGPPAATCIRCGRARPAGLLFCPACGARSGNPTPGLMLLPGSLRLLLLRGASAAGAIWPLAGGVTTMGRAQFPSDDTVPSVAASFLFHEGKLVVRDEGAGCVFVRLRAPEFLPPGALFAIGDQLLRFERSVASPADEKETGTGVIPLLGAPPAAGVQLRLERILLGGRIAAAWVRPSPIEIGRAQGALHFPEDAFVSGRHCQLEADSGGAILRDLGSSNGTFVQVPPGGERALAVGDTVRIGRNILRIEAAQLREDRTRIG